MRVDEGFDNQSAGGVEQIGIRTAIAVVGVGRACDDGTEARVSLCGRPKFPLGL